MVYFTCNHCGDSVKKPAVEKHYNTKCRGAPVSVSCMDCLKDFHGQEFAGHTKCITEMQKYSGKDYKPRESENKGAKKQESWTETIHSILDSTDYQLKPNTRQALEKLQGYDNVPRKKAKFLNFVTNSVHIPRATVEDVWNVLEKELQKMKEAKQINNDNSNKVNNTEIEENQSAKVDQAHKVRENGIESSEITGKKKKQKQKHKATENGFSDAAQIDEPAKKKKKSNQENEGQRNGIAENGSVKEKKQSKKQQKETEDQQAAVAAESSTVLDVEDASNAEEGFQWAVVLERIASKNADGILLEKLKKKVLKKYLNKLSIEELAEKQQKTFEKRFKKYMKRATNLQIDGDLVKVC